MIKISSTTHPFIGVKSIFILLIFIIMPNFSMAIDKVKKERREDKKERVEVKQERRVIVRKKFDTRSREQKRKDRNILCLMALAAFVIFKTQE